MDIQSFLGVLGRRWWVVIPGLIVVVGLTLGVAKVVKPTYKATSKVVLCAPPVTGEKSATASSLKSCLANVSGLSDSTVVFLAGMSSPQAVQAVGTDKGWTITSDDSSSAPLLFVTAEEKNAKQAVDLVNKVDEVIAEQLAASQKTNDPTVPVIISQVIAKDATASAVQGSRLRAMVATFVLGLILVASLAFAIDALANSRASRRGTPKLSRRERRRARKEPIEDHDAAESPVVAPVKHRRIRGA